MPMPSPGAHTPRAPASPPAPTNTLHTPRPAPAGVLPAVVNEKGEELAGECEGMLCIKQAWPSTLRTVYGDHERYQTNYFA
jgi:acyl-coenzyme A synthetase/AMP-(fatty) acid ligase